MIVVDASVIVHFLLEGDSTGHAEALRRDDPDWIAPARARSEVRNVLAALMRSAGMPLEHAIATMEIADELLYGRTYRIPSPMILACSSDTRLTAYDCEYVVLAREMSVPLVTTDREVLRSCPDVAVQLTSYA